MDKVAGVVADMVVPVDIETEAHSSTACQQIIGVLGGEVRISIRIFLVLNTLV